MQDFLADSVEPIHADSFFSVSKTGEIHERLCYEYSDPEGFYRNVVNDDDLLREEVQKFADNMQYYLDKERVEINGQRVRSQVDYADIFLKGKSEVVAVLFLIDFEGSFNDHSKFLTSRGRYEFLFDLRPDDYKAWAKGLKKAGYATDRKYPKKLISFIENFELYKYDDLVLDDRAYRKYAKAHAYEIPEDNQVAVVEREKESDGRVAYRSSIATYTVDKGDTLYSIAREHNLTVDELKELNQLRSNHLDIGQELIVSE